MTRSLTGCLLVALFVMVGASSGAAQDFQAVTPALRVVAKTGTYLATTPPLRIITKSEGFRVITTRLRIVAKTDSYRAQTPTLRIVATSNAYRATTPTLRIFARPHTFRVKTRTLRIVSSTNAFRAATPTLSVLAKQESDRTSEPSQNETITDVVQVPLVQCQDLLQCFPKENILRVESDLTSLGYAPDSYPTFCQDVAQSLGECSAQSVVSSTSGDGDSSLPTLVPAPQPETEDEATALNFNRCPPLDEYAIDLQRRGDAGEDTEDEEEQLTLIIVAASQHLLQGRADRWCKQITENLP